MHNNTFLYTGVQESWNVFKLELSRLFICITELKNKQTPWPLVRERTIPTERLPLVDEI
jgi:hypothetical protein